MRLFFFAILLFLSQYGFAQLLFFSDTVYFKSKPVHKISIGPDGNVWCLTGASNTGIGMITTDGLEKDKTAFLNSVTSANFGAIQGYDNGEAFVGTNGDFLYRLYADGTALHMTTSAGILEDSVLSIGLTNFKHSLGPDINRAQSLYFFKPRCLLLATQNNLYISENTIDFSFLYSGFINFNNQQKFSIDHIEKDFASCSNHDFFGSSYRYKVNVTFTDRDTSSFLYRNGYPDLTLYDSVSYNNVSVFQVVNCTALNYFRLKEYSEVSGSSFMYWGSKTGLKKRSYVPNSNSTEDKYGAQLLKNQEVFSVKLAPFRIFSKDTIYTVNDTVVKNYKIDVIIDRYVFAGSDSGFYYGKANFNRYNLTQYDTLKRAIPTNASFTKVYDIAIDTNNCGFIWLGTDNGLYKVRTNFQKDIIYNSIAPQGTINLCNKQIKITATLNSITDVQWQQDGVDIPNATSLNFTTSLPGMYRYRVNNGLVSACYSKPTSLIKDTSLVFTFPDSSLYNICPGQKANLTVHGIRNDYRYNWYKNGIVTNQTDTLYTATVSGLYNVLVTNCYDKTAFSDTVKVRVSTIAKPRLSVVKNPICSDQTTSVYLTVSGYSTEWQKNGSINTAFNDNNTISGVPYSKYLVTIKDTVGCSAISNVVSIGGIAYPSLSIVPNRTSTLCKGTEMSLQALAGSSKLLWSTGAVIPQITIAEAGQYIVKTWFDTTCKAVDSVIIVAVYPPTFKLKADTVFCFGELLPIQITAPKGFSTYLWNETKTEENTYVTDKAGSVSLLITDMNNCTVSSAINIQDKCSNLKIPNIFTPNNDGVNDVFEIQNLIPNSELNVFNRWGTVVYSTSNYNNNWKAEGLTDGIYYYSLFDTYYNNKYKGWLEIAR